MQEAAAANQMKCEAVCAVGRLVAFCSLAAANWLAPQLVSHMVSHGKEVCHIIPEHHIKQIPEESLLGR